MDDGSKTIVSELMLMIKLMAHDKRMRDLLFYHISYYTQVSVCYWRCVIYNWFALKPG